MARKKTAFYKMKGHTLPGINQRVDKSPKSSAFQKDLAITDYQAGMNLVNTAMKGGASKEEVRDIVKAHNKKFIGKDYAKSGMSNSLISFGKLRFNDSEKNKETTRETNIDTKETPNESAEVQISAISPADQKIIVERYGYGPDETGQRSKDLEIMRENFARRN